MRKSKDKPLEVPVLTGYRGKLGAYRVWSRGDTLVEESLQDSGEWKAVPLTSAQRASIDRITLSESAAKAPFWMLPVMWKNNGELQVANPGKPNAKLRVRCLVRCWLEVETEAVTLWLEAKPSTAGKLALVTFEIKEIKLGNAVTGPTDYSGKGLVKLSAKRLQPQDIATGFLMPVAAQRVGLAGLSPAIDLYFLKYGWRFLAAPEQEDGLLLTFEKEVGVKRQVHTLKGFSVPVDSEQWDMVLPSGPSQGPKPYVLLEQCQATGYGLDQFKEATQFLWRLSVRVPHTAAGPHFNETVVQPVLGALDEIRSGSPVSLLPKFTGSEPIYWSAQYLIEDGYRLPNVPENDLQFVPLDGTTKAKIKIRAKYFTPEPPKPGTAARAVALTLPGLKTTQANEDPLNFSAAVLSGDQHADIGDPGEQRFSAWSFVLAHRLPPVGVASGEEQVVKMGALDLIFFPIQRPAHVPNDLIANIDPEGDGSVFAETRFWAGVDADGRVRDRDGAYTLAVLGIQPGGQDDVPGDRYLSDLGARVREKEEYASLFRRRTPLVFRQGKFTVDWKGVGFVLTCREKTSPGSNQTVQATLKVVAADPATNLAKSELEAYVLDPEPFLFARVRASDFREQYSQAVTNEIGNWTNREDAQGWELAAGAEGFNLDLPPQGLGEAMHKRKGESDVVPGQPIDFRLTPAATLRLQASYFEQRYADAPWNLRRILGYPGQRAPGAQMDRAQFELFYGMNVEIQKPDARLAEIGSRFGSMMGAQYPAPTWPATRDQIDIYSERRMSWAHLQPQLRSRLAVLEPWREGRPGPAGFLEDNRVQVQLREQAKLRYPIPGVEPGDPFHTDGLAGGWAWGFESHNILQAILRERKSVSAELHNLFFSSLGGWGHQKAVFDRGLSTIYSQVSMGRVESITIERIGRIEPFWNRAKHVIVYRRSVSPTRQFYLEQERFLGVPLLRKSEEYVELIEEERPFPDANTPVQNRGFVVACHFDGKPPRIAVNSKWGGDVGSTGWQVPLWRRDAAPSDVYPRPDVGLKLRGKESSAAFRQSAANPEIGRFYTNTDLAVGSNPDKWPAVEGISFDRVDPDAFTHKSYADDAPEDQPIAAGSARFTFRLDPAPAPADVVADRMPEAIAARISNVTVMRGFIPGLPGPGTPEDSLRKVDDLRGSLGNAFAPALSRLAANPEGNIKDVLKEVSQKIAGLKTQFDQAGASLTEQETAFCDELSRRLKSQFDVFSKPIRQEAEAAFTAIGNQFLSVIARIKQEEDDEWGKIELKGVAQRLKDELDELWFGENGCLTVLRSMRGLAGDAAQTLRRADAQIADAGDAALHALDRARAALYTFDESTDPAELGIVLDRAREAVEEQLKSISFLIAEPIRQWIGTQIDTIRLEVELDGDGALGLRSIRTELVKIALDFRDATNLGPALAVLKIAREHIAAWVKRVRDKMQALWSGPLEQLSANPILTNIENLWDKADRALRPYLHQVIDAAADIDALETQIGAAIRVFMGGLDERLSALLDEVRQNLGEYAGDICRLLGKHLIPTIKKLIDHIGDLLATDLLKPLADAAQVAADAVRQELERIENQLAAVLDQLSERARLSFPNVSLGEPNISPDAVLRLLRAFGEPPRLPGLQFSLPSGPQLTLPNCGYYFFNFKDAKDALPALLPQVDLSPLRSYASNLLDSVKLVNPLRIDLPVTGLLDRLVAPDLSKFDLASVFRNWGGLELANLFPKLKLPPIAKDNVRVAHGVEPSTRSGWLLIEADVPFGSQPIDVFSLSGINMRLNRGRFQGISRMDVVPGQPPKQKTSGSITGDWDLSVGGFPIATLESCGVKYEEGGRLEFDISPDRVKLQSVLTFLADLMASLGYQDSGFSFGVNEKGAITTLSLPLPDIQAGAFGLANLNLGFFFSINFLGEFTLATGLRVGRRTAPFTLTIFILGGAGYFETEVTYTPSSGEFATFVAIGIFASASLAIALGPIRGGVYVYFGIAADFVARSTGSSSLKIAIVLLFRGEVSLLGIVSVSLCLMLEAAYRSGGGLSGRGRVSYSIKIGWFLSINVTADVEYTFGSSPSRKQVVETTTAANLAARSRRYEEMFV